MDRLTNGQTYWQEESERDRGERETGVNQRVKVWEICQSQLQRQPLFWSNTGTAPWWPRFLSEAAPFTRGLSSSASLRLHDDDDKVGGFMSTGVREGGAILSSGPRDWRLGGACSVRSIYSACVKLRCRAWEVEWWSFYFSRRHGHLSLYDVLVGAERERGVRRPLHCVSVCVCEVSLVVASSQTAQTRFYSVIQTLSVDVFVLQMIFFVLSVMKKKHKSLGTSPMPLRGS